MQATRCWRPFLLLLLLNSAPVLAASSATASVDFHWSVVDLDPNDGVEANAEFVPVVSALVDHLLVDPDVPGEWVHVGSWVPWSELNTVKGSWGGASFDLSATSSRWSIGGSATDGNSAYWETAWFRPFDIPVGPFEITPNTRFTLSTTVTLDVNADAGCRPSGECAYAMASFDNNRRGDLEHGELTTTDGRQTLIRSFEYTEETGSVGGLSSIFQVSFLVQGAAPLSPRCPSLPPMRCGSPASAA